MEYDREYQLRVYIDDKRALIGDLSSRKQQDDVLLGLLAVSDAASGNDTLDMIYARSGVPGLGTPEPNSVELSCGDIYGDDLQASITFIPGGDSLPGVRGQAAMQKQRPTCWSPCAFFSSRMLRHKGQPQVHASTGV
jgi:hypothetical protein